jgi:hypothetical protein
MDKCYSASSSIMAQWLVLFICNVASISLRVQLLMRFFFFEIEWLGALQVTTALWAKGSTQWQRGSAGVSPA